MKEKEKKEQKEYEYIILSLRAKELNSKIEAKPGKGDVQVITWKIITVGEYIGPRLLKSILEEFRNNIFDMENINLLIGRSSPVKSLNLYKWLSN